MADRPIVAVLCGDHRPPGMTAVEAAAWRARDMVGAMVQGTASIYVLDALGNGVKTARALAREIDPDADALIRLAPTRLVWWRGWSSGSADLA